MIHRALFYHDPSDCYLVVFGEKNIAKTREEGLWQQLEDVTNVEAHEREHRRRLRHPGERRS